MNPVETYLQSLYDIYSSGAGVPEMSGYGALANLFNEIGKTLKPRVRCIINIANKGAGLPDGGLFTPDQFQKRAKGELLEGQLPSRGAIEVKPTTVDVDTVAASEQVRRYLKRYQQVLVTNYRDFLVVGLDRDGNLVKRERFTLAVNDAEFWKAAARPRPLTSDEAREVRNIARRIAAIVLLEPALDDNYQAIKNATYSWPV
ncbi:MAG TPA: hypothetical protein VF397_05960 [Pyrinomonadaceae bacterium]